MEKYIPKYETFKNHLDEYSINYDFLLKHEYHEGDLEVYYFYISLEDIEKLKIKPDIILENLKIGIIIFYQD